MGISRFPPIDVIVYRKMLNRDIPYHCKPLNAHCIECQLTCLAQEIFSRLSKDEIDFLLPLMPAYMVNEPYIVSDYLLEKHGNEYGTRIENIISDSEVYDFHSKYKNDHVRREQMTEKTKNDIRYMPNLDYLGIFAGIEKTELRPHPKIDPKQAMAFSYIACLISNKRTTLAQAILCAASLYKQYHEVDEWSKQLAVNEGYSGAAAEADILRLFDNLSDDIFQALSENQRKYLASSSDPLIMLWLRSEMWPLGLDGAGCEKRSPKSFLSRNNILDKEMRGYFFNKYGLIFDPNNSILEKYQGLRYHPSDATDNTFCFKLAAAFAAGKLKNANYSMEDCLKMFDAYSVTRHWLWLAKEAPHP
jgi:hypothetical protein